MCFLDSNKETGSFDCTTCGKCYKWKASLRNHLKNECGKEPQYQCDLCSYRTRQKGNFLRHLASMHKLHFRSTDIRKQDDAGFSGSG